MAGHRRRNRLARPFHPRWSRIIANLVSQNSVPPIIVRRVVRAVAGAAEVLPATQSAQGPGWVATAARVNPPMQVPGAEAAALLGIRSERAPDWRAAIRRMVRPAREQLPVAAMEAHLVTREVPALDWREEMTREVPAGERQASERPMMTMMVEEVLGMGTPEEAAPR